MLLELSNTCRNSDQQLKDNTIEHFICKQGNLNDCHNLNLLHVHESSFMWKQNHGKLDFLSFGECKMFRRNLIEININIT